LDRHAVETNVTDEATSSDSIIRVMPDRLANKIAAGEVVQRPASVAKELLENAIDAGAQSVQLIAKDAGSTLVQVIDDGCGMSHADAERCFQRHATSKIQSIDDLERIRTLGFRGEALASIAAVAQVELKTKRVEDDVGYRVVVEGGEITTTEPCAIPSGTSVAVRNLFYNVPARRNFLKTPATEFKHLTDTFQFIALAEPAVAFTLEHKGHTVYDLNAARGEDFFARTRTRVADLLGEEHREQLVPVEDGSSYLHVRGFVGKPAFNRKTRGEQFLFVNGRYVQSRYLSHAVRAAYGEMLPDGAFPFFALFLQLDPRRVDVNVHPTKAEVKFEDESGIYGFLRGAVRAALGRAQLTPAFRTDAGTDASSEGGALDERATGRASSEESDSPQPRPFQPRRRSRDTSERRSGKSGSSSQSQGARPTAQQAPGDVSRTLYQGASGPEASSSGLTPSDGEGADESAETAQRDVWSLHDTYLVTPTEEGVMLVDQQAAHERVLYERTLAQMRQGRVESQQLLFPHTIELSPADAELVEELLPDLRALGFDLERLSGRTVAIRGVPVDARTGQEQTLLEELLEQCKTQQFDASKRQKKLTESLARRNAIRRGQALSEAERRALLTDLFECEMPYADPRGNPTVLNLSMEELEKQFDR